MAVAGKGRDKLSSMACSGTQGDALLAEKVLLGLGEERACVALTDGLPVLPKAAAVSGASVGTCTPAPML